MEQNAALLVMDMQEGILAMLPGADAIIASVARAITAAREKKIPVIYVVVGFRNGTPEISMRNKSFSGYKERFAGADVNSFMKIHQNLEPLPGEPVVVKRRVSAFTGSDLEVILRSMEVQHIILTGIATSGVVLSTLREAADKDYKITVITDCCADRDEEVHRVLTTKVFTRQAAVHSFDDWNSARS